MTCDDSLAVSCRTELLNWLYIVQSQNFFILYTTLCKITIITQSLNHCCTLIFLAVDLTLVDGEEDCLYFCSNSLGLMPRKAEEKLSVEFQKWAEM